MVAVCCVSSEVTQRANVSIYKIVHSTVLLKTMEEYTTALYSV